MSARSTDNLVFHALCIELVEVEQFCEVSLPGEWIDAGLQNVISSGTQPAKNNKVNNIKVPIEFNLGSDSILSEFNAEKRIQ